MHFRFRFECYKFLDSHFYSYNDRSLSHLNLSAWLLRPSRPILPDQSTPCFKCLDWCAVLGQGEFWDWRLERTRFCWLVNLRHKRVHFPRSQRIKAFEANCDFGLIGSHKEQRDGNLYVLGHHPICELWVDFDLLNDPNFCLWCYPVRHCVNHEYQSDPRHDLRHCESAFDPAIAHTALRSDAKLWSYCNHDRFDSHIASRYDFRSNRRLSNLNQWRVASWHDFDNLSRHFWRQLHLCRHANIQNFLY